VIGVLKAKQRLGKYRIERKLGVGGFSVVYQAMDTIEGVRVALKIPHQHLVTPEVLEEFRHEARLMARLEHPNILPLKNAEFIDEKFVIVYPLGEKTLTERLQSRLSLATALDFAEQIISGVAYAHEHRIIHCDVKPDNVILFPGGRLRLADFGIAKVANRTIRASGSGTVGYVAPEQAMGRPSFRSDVFSVGLIVYRMLTGRLPEWPFEWPPPGVQRLRRRHADLTAFVRKSIEVNPRRRFRDAGVMRDAFLRIKPRVLRHARQQAQRSRTTKKKTSRNTKGKR
jgi:serine/threonine protein kinase